MANVLLVTPPTIRPRAGGDYAIDAAARAGGTLVGLVLRDSGESARLAASLDSAFMGERVSDRVVEVLEREQRSQAEALLAELGARAQASGVPFIGVSEQGNVDEVCARLVRAHQIAAVVLVVEKRSWLSRILSRSAAIQLPALANCTLTVVEEEPDDPA